MSDGSLQTDPKSNTTDLGGRQRPISENGSAPRASRRQFFRIAGAGAAVVALSGRSTALAAPAADTVPEPAKQYPFKLGVATYTFRKFSLEDTLAMTKRVGCESVCLKSFHLAMDATPEQIREVVAKVQQAELTIDGCGVVSMKKPEDVQQAFEYAKTAGIKKIVAAPTPELLPLLNEKVQEYDIRLCIHNHGPTDKFFPVPEVIYPLIKDLDRRIGMCHDIGHTVRFGADLYDSSERYADRIYDVHMKDVTAPTAKGRGTIVGRGIIDFARLFRILLKVKYAGILSFEYEENAADPLAGLAESVGYTRGVMSML